ncbi:MAG TPA: PepSY domain-containing protein [Dongiaceae bacterium]|nr:PepSY domain-containing protein [Dongiaceae bacterium]
MALKTPILAASAAVLAIAGWTGTSGAALADNDDLKCTEAAQASWMSEDATKDLLLKQGYKEVREIEVTDGHCYEVYAVDAKGEKVEIYLDPTNGDVIAKED